MSRAFSLKPPYFDDEIYDSRRSKGGEITEAFASNVKKEEKEVRKNDPTTRPMPRHWNTVNETLVKKNPIDPKP